MVVCLGGLAMDMGDSAFELSTNVSSSDTKCRLSSPSADSIQGTNMLGVSVDTSSYESLEAHEHFQHSGDDNGHIPLCAGFRRE